MTASETIADNRLKLMLLAISNQTLFTAYLYLITHIILLIYNHNIIKNLIVWFIPGHNETTESVA